MLFLLLVASVAGLALATGLRRVVPGARLHRPAGAADLVHARLTA